MVLAGVLGDEKCGVEADVRSERLQMFNVGYVSLDKGMGFIHLQKLDILRIACIRIPLAGRIHLTKDSTDHQRKRN